MDVGSTVGNVVGTVTGLKAIEKWIGLTILGSILLIVGLMYWGYESTYKENVKLKVDLAAANTAIATLEENYKGLDTRYLALTGQVDALKAKNDKMVTAVEESKGKVAGLKKKLADQLAKNAQAVIPGDCEGAFAWIEGQLRRITEQNNEK